MIAGSLLYLWVFPRIFQAFPVCGNRLHCANLQTMHADGASFIGIGCTFSLARLDYRWIPLTALLIDLLRPGFSTLEQLSSPPSNADDRILDHVSLKRRKIR